MGGRLKRWEDFRGGQQHLLMLLPAPEILRPEEDGSNRPEGVRRRVSTSLFIYLCAATSLCFSELFSYLNHTIEVVWACEHKIRHCTCTYTASALYLVWYSLECRR